MSERKNIKISPDVYDKLRGAKKDHETWNNFFNRVLEENVER